MKKSIWKLLRWLKCVASRGPLNERCGDRRVVWDDFCVSVLRRIEGITNRRGLIGQGGSLGEIMSSNLGDELEIYVRHWTEDGP